MTTANMRVEYCKECGFPLQNDEFETCYYCDTEEEYWASEEDKNEDVSNDP